MNNSANELDVLCLGHASFDLVFSVPQHPTEDDKIFADGLLHCGGGPAANAAVIVARLGYRSAFAGYLGNDLYGDRHWQELADNGVDTRFIVRGDTPTPLSAVLVKPDGKRALINYKRDTRPLLTDALDLSELRPKAVLFDGHEPHLSIAYSSRLKSLGIPSILDAGSLHEGTKALMAKVDYLVCSEKFAMQVSGSVDRALAELSVYAPNLVVTLSERGLFWRRHGEQGNLPAFRVEDVDSTGAGDAFHGAFAAAVAAGMNWLDTLRYASAAGALCCTKLGARPGLPTRVELSDFLDHNPVSPL